jgi:copper chaperone CopZ
MINKKIAFGLLLVVVTAGCSGAVPGVGGGNNPIDQVPTDAEMVMYLDSDKIQEDQETEALSELGQSAGTPTQEEALNQFEDEADIDPENIDTVAAFAYDLNSVEETPGESSFAVIAHGSFDTESVTDYIEEEGSDELEEDEYNGQTIYVEENEYGQDTAIGILGEGQMVAGDVDSVEQVIDVSAGDEDALSGDLKSEYSDIKSNSLFGMAVEVPDVDETIEQANRNGPEGIDLTVFESVEMMTFQYATPDGNIDMRAGFQSSSESDADDLSSVIDSATVLYGDTGVSEADAEIEKVDVSQDGSSVTVDYQTEVDNIEDLQDALENPTQQTQSVTG